MKNEPSIYKIKTPFLVRERLRNIFELGYYAGFDWADRDAFLCTEKTLLINGRRNYRAFRVCFGKTYFRNTRRAYSDALHRQVGLTQFS